MDGQGVRLKRQQGTTGKQCSAARHGTGTNGNGCENVEWYDANKDGAGKRVIGTPWTVFHTASFELSEGNMHVDSEETQWDKPAQLIELEEREAGAAELVELEIDPDAPWPKVLTEWDFLASRRNKSGDMVEGRASTLWASGVTTNRLLSRHIGINSHG